MQPSDARSKLLPALAIAFCVLAWGGSFAAARILLNPEEGRTGLDPITLAASRFILASLFFLGPFVGAIVRRTLGGRDLLRLALLGQIAFSVYFWLQYTGVRNTNAGLASILAVGLLPSATAMLAPLGGEARPPGRAWLALALGFAGVVAIAREKPVGAPDGSSFWIGAACLTANAFAFAIYSLLNRRWCKGMTPLTMTGGSMIFGSLGLLVMSAVSDSAGWTALGKLDRTQWGALAFLILCCSVGAYFAWTWALTRVEASRATACIYAEPVVAVALGLTVLKERYGPGAYVGAAAIALSVLMATTSRRRS